MQQQQGVTYCDVLGDLMKCASSDEFWGDAISEVAIYLITARRIEDICTNRNGVKMAVRFKERSLRRAFRYHYEHTQIEGLAHADSGAEDRVAALRHLKLLKAALQPRHFTALWLAAQGNSDTEIGGHLDIARDAARALLKRARCSLQAVAA